MPASLFSFSRIENYEGGRKLSIFACTTMAIMHFVCADKSKSVVLSFSSKLKRKSQSRERETKNLHNFSFSQRTQKTFSIITLNYGPKNLINLENSFWARLRKFLKYLFSRFPIFLEKIFSFCASKRT